MGIAGLDSEKELEERNDGFVVFGGGAADARGVVVRVGGASGAVQIFSFCDVNTELLALLSEIDG